MSLTPQQEQVLALISAGSSITVAAQSAGVHRNTIYNWLRSAPAFRLELSAAPEAKATGASRPKSALKPPSTPFAPS